MFLMNDKWKAKKMTDAKKHEICVCCCCHWKIITHTKSRHHTAKKKNAFLSKRYSFIFCCIHLSTYNTGSIYAKIIAIWIFFVAVHCVSLNGFADSQANQNCISDLFQPSNLVFSMFTLYVYSFVFFFFSTYMYKIRF